MALPPFSGAHLANCYLNSCPVCACPVCGTPNQKQHGDCEMCDWTAAPAPNERVLFVNVPAQSDVVGRPIYKLPSTLERWVTRV